MGHELVEIENDADIERRRDALLLRLLKTPPQQRPKRERKQVDKAAPKAAR